MAALRGPMALTMFLSSKDNKKMQEAIAPTCWMPKWNGQYFAMRLSQASRKNNTQWNLESGFQRGTDRKRQPS